MARILVATADGLHDLEGGQVEWPGREVTALGQVHGERWVVLDAREVVRQAGGRAESAVLEDDLEIRCLAALPGTAYLGTSEAHLFTLHGGSLRRVSSFDEAAGREGWYTPWGGPPDVRSIATTAVGDVLVNVHVGGIQRLPAAGGDGWESTLDIDADVHQVVSGPGPVGLAAAAAGLCVSVDDGRSWHVETAGMHSTYARAVCISGDHIIISASDGPDGARAALYRRQAGGSQELTKCDGGLPEWFDDNIDTGWLAADGRRVAFVTADGNVWRSDDAGASWRCVATALPPPRALAWVAA